ncbi:Hypothetical protein SMAX5B_005649 [Scophthalmus maximus]|uniref:Uncharacterized protein n=1 Tax=Scophthalmus maximus TaxID=52904 RepID=A0A2U9BBI4_SCOMX|nr:Hypothetical protein SMAX5B_005649 [Scophthalmus maximus]
MVASMSTLASSPEGRVVAIRCTRLLWVFSKQRGRTKDDMFAVLVIVSVVIGGVLSAPVLTSGDSTAELALLFDPGLLKRHVSLTDDYGERPVLPRLPPDSGNPYRPNLEDEYY